MGHSKLGILHAHRLQLLLACLKGRVQRCVQHNNVSFWLGYQVSGECVASQWLAPTVTLKAPYKEWVYEFYLHATFVRVLPVGPPAG